MKQPTLFNTFDESARVKPAARRTDPDTSHEAAEAYESSGNAASDREAILRVIQTTTLKGPEGFPLHGITAGEIAKVLGGKWDNVRVSRRTAEMDDKTITRGMARICTVKGTSMLTWHPLET